jgi:hypothetical protein
MSDREPLAFSALTTLSEFGLTDKNVAARASCKQADLDQIRADPTALVKTEVLSNLLRLVREAVRTALWRLKALGMQSNEIAPTLGCSETTVSRLLNDEDWSFSMPLAVRVARTLRDEECKRFNDLQQALFSSALVVLETFTGSQATIDEAARAQLRKAFQAALTGAFTNTAASARLPSDIHGALASFGPPELALFLVLLDSGKENVSTPVAEVRRLKLLIHELSDLIRRLQSKVERLEGPPRRPEGLF